MLEGSPLFGGVPIAVWVPVILAASWVVLSLVFSVVSGWQGLAGRYGTDERPREAELGLTSGSVGWIGYRNILIPAATPAAFYLRVMVLFRLGHKPLRIPWDDVEELGTAALFSGVRVRLGTGGAVVTLPEYTWRRLQQARGTERSG